MCGLVGLIQTITCSKNVSNADWFKDALYVDTLRGEDSTGICIVPASESPPVIYKKAVPGSDFIQLKIPHFLLSSFNGYNIVMGHNRAATRGGVSAATAHPFNKGHIYLAHNGTLTSVTDLPGTSSVDSERITWAMAEESDPVKVLESLEGAYALTWYDSKEEVFRLARNRERPLWLGFDKERTTMYYASEDWMIEDLANRYANITVDKLVELKVGELVTIDRKLPTLDIDQFVINGFTPKQKAATTYDYRSYYTTKTKYEEKYKNRKEKEDAFIKDTGFRTGEKLLFYPSSFIPYTNTPGLGTLEGVTEDPRNNGLVYLVKSYSFPAEDLLLEEPDYIVGTLTSISIKDDGSVYLNVKDAYVPSDEEVLTFCMEESIVEDLVKGPGGKYITETEFDDLTKHGCCQCGDNIFLEDADELIWTYNNQPYCPGCVKEIGKDPSFGSC